MKHPSFVLLQSKNPEATLPDAAVHLIGSDQLLE